MSSFFFSASLKAYGHRTATIKKVIAAMLGYISMFRLGHLSKVRAEQSRPPLPLLTYRITPILSKRMGWEKKFHGKICIYVSHQRLEGWAYPNG